MLKIGSKVMFKEDGITYTGTVGAYYSKSCMTVVLDGPIYPEYAWFFDPDDEACINLGDYVLSKRGYIVSEIRLEEIKGDDSMKRMLIVIGNRNLNGDVYHDLGLGTVFDDYTINGGVVIVRKPGKKVGDFLSCGDVLYLDECKYCHFNDLRDLRALGYKFDENTNDLLAPDGYMAIPKEILHIINKTYKIHDITDEYVEVKVKGEIFYIAKRYIGTLIELRK